MNYFSLQYGKLSNRYQVSLFFINNTIYALSEQVAVKKRHFASSSNSKILTAWKIIYIDLLSYIIQKPTETYKLCFVVNQYKSGLMKKLCTFFHIETKSKNKAISRKEIPYQPSLGPLIVTIAVVLSPSSAILDGLVNSNLNCSAFSLSLSSIIWMRKTMLLQDKLKWS